MMNFRNSKFKKAISTVIVVLLVLAMVAPLVLSVMN